MLENVSRITICDLKAWGYLADGRERSGGLTLSSGKEKTGSLRITVRIDQEERSFIGFDYLLNGEPVKYQHRIELFPCHYGKHRFYFICRDTGKRVTALFMVDGYYSSRYYHKLVYQCSREHRSTFDSLHRSQNLQNKAEWLEKVGHPTKAKRYFRKAEEYDELSVYDLFESIERRLMKDKRFVRE